MRWGTHSIEIGTWLHFLQTSNSCGRCHCSRNRCSCHPWVRLESDGTWVGQVLHEPAEVMMGWVGQKWRGKQLFGRMCLLGPFSFTDPAATKLSARRKHLLNPLCHNLPSCWTEFGCKSSQTAWICMRLMNPNLFPEFTQLLSVVYNNNKILYPTRRLLLLLPTTTSKILQIKTQNAVHHLWYVFI